MDSREVDGLLIHIIEGSGSDFFLGMVYNIFLMIANFKFQ